MVVVNRSGHIEIVNTQAERIFGYARAELLGQPVELLIPERYRSEHSARRAAFFSAPRVRDVGSDLELFGLHKDGTEFPIEIGLSPLETEEGTLVSSAIRDVTDRKRIETALAIANRELESFSHSVAHDLRAPLWGMKGFARILLDEHGDALDEEGRDFLREIHESAVRMMAMVDALSSLARTTRSELNPAWVDLSELARSVVAQLSQADPSRRVDAVLGESLHARVDPQLARTLLENLIGNAWKFTSKTEAPRIEFGAVRQENGNAFFVRDNGAGFDMAYARRLFAPFQRLHTLTEFPGTGIGLATAQRIVHRHGGRIWADGRVGEGATFFFTLSR
jgi:PAS domain S-box-containing protein